MRNASRSDHLSLFLLRHVFIFLKRSIIENMYTPCTQATFLSSSLIAFQASPHIFEISPIVPVTPFSLRFLRSSDEKRMNAVGARTTCKKLGDLDLCFGLAFSFFSRGFLPPLAVPVFSLITVFEAGASVWRKVQICFPRCRDQKYLFLLFGRAIGVAVTF